MIGVDGELIGISLMLTLALLVTGRYRLAAVPLLVVAGICAGEWLIGKLIDLVMGDEE